ncbi:MAG: hypothetical protein IKU73_06250 [Clostridia bacterium]|nr:hypothetical protein [Clostridia bacterium]
MKRTVLVLFLLAALLAASCAHADTALSYGELKPVRLQETKRLAFRTGPGTKYTELFSLDPARMYNLFILQEEEGGTVYWGHVEFKCYKGLYRAYTGLHDLEVDEIAVPAANQEGVYAYVSGVDAAAYAGPGQEYVCYDWVVPCWTDLMVYHEENGYVMADFVLPDAPMQPYSYEEELMLTRAWLRIEDIENYTSVYAQQEATEAEAQDVQ